MILKVAQLGHPVLRTRARAVTAEELRSPDVQRLIDDMVETMREYQGVGLAAPQVHVGLRIAVIECHHNPRYPEAPEFPLTVLVNPVLKPLTEDTLEWWEGCLSIPGLRGAVARPRRVRIEALDREGRKTAGVVEGFTAIVHQHEVDHLDGVLFLDRMMDMTRLAFEKEYQVHWAQAGEEAADGEPAAGEPAAASRETDG